ncbi:hypothetical protein P280DRAFT_480912 [Massarina eburnea CBS 473.64]|uniref:Uncharacterized protein n=1 Tax=Massarina eburnea CBS 473.64 TaxID=1395130 RepID=A0A6A6RXH8_9PLEO|nr:hypothetical protein P280DRAFT_480912 [Massarina eburnea CBS 473.64]
MIKVDGRKVAIAATAVLLLSFAIYFLLFMYKKCWLLDHRRQARHTTWFKDVEASRHGPVNFTKSCKTWFQTPTTNDEVPVAEGNIGLRPFKLRRSGDIRIPKPAPIKRRPVGGYPVDLGLPLPVNTPRVRPKLPRKSISGFGIRNRLMKLLSGISRNSRCQDPGSVEVGAGFGLSLWKMLLVVISLAVFFCGVVILFTWLRAHNRKIPDGRWIYAVPGRPKGSADPEVGTAASLEETEPKPYAGFMSWVNGQLFDIDKLIYKFF